MGASKPESPGWYPDPDILPGSSRSLRYWNGRHWTDRRRTAPVLTTLRLGGPVGAPLPRAIEGPIRAAELPAPTAEVSASRDSPGGRSDTLDRPTGAEVRGIELPTSTGGSRGKPPQPPGGGGGGDGDGGHGGPDAPWPDESTDRRSRRKWWVFASIGVLCAVGVTLAGEAMRPKSPGPRVLTDAQFVKSANADCAKTIAGLRPPDGGAFGSFVTPAQAATEIDNAAAGLDKLADQLEALPAAPADKPFITTWLNGWHQYDDIGRQYATFLRQHGATAKAPAVLATGATVVKAADNFALANGLKSCEFIYVDTTDASDM